MGKKIWIFNQFAGDSISGWGERHLFIGKYLVKKGYQVTIFSGSYTHMFKHNRSGNKRFEKSQDSGVNFIWVKTPVYKAESISRFYSMLVFMIRLFLIREKDFEKPDIIIVSSMPLFPIIPATFFKWKWKLRNFVFEVRDFWPLTPVLLGKAGKNNPFVLLMGWIQKLGFKRAETIVSVPSNPYSYVAEIIGSSEKVVHIPNGAELVLAPPHLLAETEAQLSKIPKEKFIAGYAGTFGFANSLEHLIEAARLLRNRNEIVFVLLGDGYLKGEIMQQAKDLSNVIFLDRMPKNQVSFFIDKIDIGLFCWQRSKLYQLGVSPNKYFDYMSHAKPIVIAGDAKNDPAVGAGCAFMASPEDPSSIANAIQLAADMPKEKIQEMGIAGKQAFLTNHTYEMLAEKYIQVIEK
jgi:glycosyltransferase involved in cell wall biosynthesis